MSNTDKDAPFWVLSTWWEPDHHRCQYSWIGKDRECDLPPEPIRTRPVKTTWRTNPNSCCWIPTWDHCYRPYGPQGVPPWYVRLEFTGPERRRVRDECREALKEYNATGEVDTIPAVTQHRHMARWSWW